LTFTGHKFGAPKGIGGLFCRRSAPFDPFIHGGHQEQGQRGGTESVPLIVGLGAASQIAQKTATRFEKQVAPLRDQLETGIISQIKDVQINGLGASRLANTTNLSFDKIASEALLLLLDKEGLCASSGSACMALSDAPSYVVEAMAGQSRALSAIRFSLGALTSKTDVTRAIQIVAGMTDKLRGEA
jgi:cysteine desulfurase